jgi:hypothetical protein
MLVMGSGIPGRLRSIFTGVQPISAPDATLVYATPVAVIDGTPYYAAPLDSYGSAGRGATPVTEIQGTPVYARPDAVVVVAPAKTTDLVRQQPVSDILEPCSQRSRAKRSRLGCSSFRQPRRVWAAT